MRVSNSLASSSYLLEGVREYDRPLHIENYRERLHLQYRKQHQPVWMIADSGRSFIYYPRALYSVRTLLCPVAFLRPRDGRRQPMCCSSEFILTQKSEDLHSFKPNEILFEMFYLDGAQRAKGQQRFACLRASPACRAGS